MSKAEISILQGVLNKQRLLALSPDDWIRKAARMMSEYHVSAAGVLDENDNFIGLITEQDIVKRAVGVHKNVDRTRVKEIMNRNPVAISVCACINDALITMTNNDVRNLPVLDGHQLVGIIDIRDLYKEVQVLMHKAIKERDSVITYFYGESYGGYSANTT
jgi:CBS domain-containing protein